MDTETRVISHHSAVSSDSPAIAFAEELIAAYPEAKVILHERDIESWFRSFDDSIVNAMHSPLMNLVADLDRWVTGPVREVQHKWAMGHLGMDNMKSKDEMSKAAKPAYKRHYETVRRVCPRERLLEFKIEEGWEPLCRFLGKDVPRDERTGEVLPFPRINDGKALDEMLRAIAVEGIKNFLRHAIWYIVAGLVGLVACWYVWRTSTSGKRTSVHE